MYEEADPDHEIPVVAALLNHLRQGSSSNVELDHSAVSDVVGCITEMEARVQEIERKYQEAVNADFDNKSDASTDSQHAMIQALAEMTKAITHDRSKPSTNTFALTKAIGELKLDKLEDGEDGQLLVWEHWFKATIADQAQIEAEG